MKTSNYKFITLTILVIAILISITPIFTTEPPKETKYVQHMMDTNKITIDNENGTYTTTFSTQPIAYKNPEDNKWKPIDKTIKSGTKTKDGDTFNYYNENGTYSAYFSETYDKPFQFMFEKDGYNIKIGDTEIQYRNSTDSETIANKRTGTVLQTANNISYIEGMGNLTPIYYYYETTVKEKTMIPNRLALRNTTLEGEVFIRRTQKIVFSDSLDVIINGEAWDKTKKITTSNKVLFQINNNTIFSFPKPYLLDSSNNKVEAQYTLRKAGSFLFADWEVPYSYLDNTSLTYPLYIDPTVQAVYGVSYINDTYVDQQYPNTNYDYDTFVTVTQDNQNLINRRGYYLLNITNLTGLTSHITSATLSVEITGYDSQGGTIIESGSYEILPTGKAFNTLSMTWNNQPCGTTTTINASCNSTASSVHKINTSSPPSLPIMLNFDITQASNKSINHAIMPFQIGILVNITNNTANSKNSTFYYTNIETILGGVPPYITVTYVANDPPTVTNLTQTPVTLIPHNTMIFNATIQDVDAPSVIANWTFYSNFHPNPLFYSDSPLTANQTSQAVMGNVMYGQPFYPSVTGYVTNVSTYIYRYNLSNPASFFLEIWGSTADTDAGVPTKTKRMARANITLKDSPLAAYLPYHVYFNETPYVIAGKKYFLVYNGSLSPYNFTPPYAYIVRAVQNIINATACPSNLLEKVSTSYGNSWSSGSGCINSNITISNFTYKPDAIVDISAQGLNTTITGTNKTLDFTGSFNWYVCANDSLGGEACSFTKSVNVLAWNGTDTTQPSVTFYSPNNNSARNGNQSLRSEVIDNGGIQYVEYYWLENATGSWTFFKNATEVATNIYEVIWDTGGATQSNNKSNYQFRAWAVDGSGNSKNGSFHNFSIDKNIPIVNFTKVTYPYTWTNFTKYGLNLTIVINATDTDTAIANITSNSSLLTTANTFTKYFNQTRNVAGVYSLWNLSYLFIHQNNSGTNLLIQANISDTASPTRNQLKFEMIFINLDNNKPSFTSCSTNNTNPQDQEDVNFNCDFTEGVNESGLRNFTLSHNFTGSWKNETWKSLTGLTDTGFQNYTFKNNGSFSYFMWVNDAVGNQKSTVVSNISVKSQDKQPPIITINSPANNSAIKNSTFNITYTPSDNNQVWCSLYVDGSFNNNNQTPITLNTTNLIEALNIPDGYYDFIIECFDIFDNINTSLPFNYTIDTITPKITIDNPTNSTYQFITLNYTINETNPSQCTREWTNQSGQVYNKTMPNCANDTWTANSGSHIIRLWLNDTANNVNVSSVSFTIDTIPPNIAIQSPTNSTYSTQNITLNYTTNTNQSCVYDLDGTNYSLPTCDNTTLTNLSITTHKVIIWVNDTYNNVNQSSVTFTIVNFGINIISPKNAFTYYTSNISVNFTILSGIDTCVLETDSQNFSLPNCKNTTHLYNTTGLHYALLWANGTDGNWYSSNKHIFSTDTYTNLLIILIFFVIIMLLILYKRRRKNQTRQ